MRIVRHACMMFLSAMLIVGGTVVATQAPASAVAPLASITGHGRYCSANQLYIAVRNDSTAATHQTRINHNGVTTYRTFSLAAGATGGSYTPGVTGAYSVYVYRWTGTAYSYVAGTSGTLTCRVGAALARSGNYARVTLSNTGTATAGVYVRKLAPAAPLNYYYGIVAGGTAVTPWIYVGPSGTHYAIYNELYNSTTSVSPVYFTGLS